VVEALSLAPGHAVADIGAGSGYFALPFAAAVGPAGRVYAVDIDQELLRYLDRRVRLRRLAQVQVWPARPESAGLPVSSVDVIFICDTLHHIERPERYLAGLRPALRPGGQLAIIEFRKVREPDGPPLAHRLSREDLLTIAGRAGYELDVEHVFLPRQTFLVFRPR
jgi:ubiquinone/menaquinone biosynthesis C-methylase UbiE